MTPNDPRNIRRRPTYDAIAARAEVSKTTVSLVMRGLAKDRIPESTYERVMAASRELGYYPNRLVQSMQKGRTEMLAVIAPQASLEHVGRILDGIREEAAAHGYSLLLGSASENADDERASAERLLEQRADGLIRFSAVADSSRVPDWLAEAVARGVPCVVVDDVNLEGQIDCVVSDDLDGAYQAVRYLIEQGHRHIAHFRGDIGRTAAEERVLGYLRAVREAGLSYERVVGQSYGGEGLEDALASLLAEPIAPTALFCCADSVAVNALTWLRRSGHSVPGDVSVVGFADGQGAQVAGITTVAQPFNEMGVRAAQRLFRRIAGDADPYRVDRLPNRLIIRASSAGI